jgi:hypothetical protein
METQNKHFYLNWGGKNSVTSMKPSHTTVIGSIPFEGKTVYRNDFQGKKSNASQIIVPENSISRFPK